jgi:branched-chain amino acid transport system ATP-binding protein
MTDAFETPAAPDARPVLLETRGLCVHFGGIKAVDELSFVFEEGRLYGLVGPNGSGKSTFIAAVSRLIAPTAGELLFEGNVYNRKSAPAVAQMGVGRTFQTVRLLPTLTVLENVMIGADTSLFGTSIAKAWLNPVRSRRAEAAARARAGHELERLGLTDVRNRVPTELSYGQQRRVEIARAMATSPRILLLDEPTAGMTSSERQEVAEVLLQLRGEGVTQLLVDHDVDLMVEVSDHLYAMNFGREIASGLPTAVVQDPLVQEAYLGSGSHADA